MYLDAPLEEGATLDLPREQAHYATRVLRLRPDDTLVVFNGKGGEFEAVLADVGKRHATLRLTRFSPLERESPLTTRLILGLSRGERMDVAIQKAVELGVSTVQPVVTEFSVSQLDAERAHRRRAHWQQIACAACEQCGRNQVPTVTPLVSLEEYLREPLTAQIGIVCAPDAVASLASLSAPRDNAMDVAINLLVGPEGGLSAAETAAARTNGYHAVRVGPRVLRTETAAMAVLAALQTLWGDWRPDEASESS